MASHYRVVATHIGTSPVSVYDRRTCRRCGIEKSVGGKHDRSKPYMCGDCRIVDRPMAIRLGIAK